MLKKMFNYAILNTNIKLSKEKIQSMQWKKFKKIINYAYATVPFYREKFDKAGIKPKEIKSREDLNKIPITTKEELRFSEDKILSRNYKKASLKDSRTSGSTGLPFTSYFDDNSWSILKYASKLRARRICGMKLNSKIVNIECYNQKTIEKMNKKYKKLIGPKMYYLSIFDNLKNHIAFYKKIKPQVLYGLPSYFLELGEYIKKNKIKWKNPDLIFTSGEFLDSHTRLALKQYFGDKIYDIYGTTELKEVSWECPNHPGYHINEDLYLVEFLKRNKNEDEGEILVTSLTNKAMPLIRYSVGDRGKPIDSDVKCKIPFSLMSPTLGRSVDYFILKDGRRFSPYTLTTTIEPIKGILQYQLIQRSYNKIEVRIRIASKDDRRIKETINKKLKNLLGDSIKIKIIIYKKDIPRDKNGKYRVVKSLVNLGEKN